MTIILISFVIGTVTGGCQKNSQRRADIIKVSLRPIQNLYLNFFSGSFHKVRTQISRTTSHLLYAFHATYQHYRTHIFLAFRPPPSPLVRTYLMDAPSRLGLYHIIVVVKVALLKTVLLTSSFPQSWSPDPCDFFQEGARIEAGFRK